LWSVDLRVLIAQRCNLGMIDFKGPLPGWRMPLAPLAGTTDAGVLSEASLGRALSGDPVGTASGTEAAGPAKPDAPIASVLIYAERTFCSRPQSVDAVDLSFSD
jgi:hypothetical protein